VRVDSQFAFHIDPHLPSAQVAPLFCAGATVYEPLRRANVGKGHKVGVVGIGGLGHLGIQFAAALGAEVTAISRSENKKQTAKELGAQHFLNSADPEQIKAAQLSFDFVLQTENVSSDLSSYLNLLTPLGTLLVVGIPESALQIAPSALVMAGRTIMGSLIASPTRIEEMLKLASEKKILAHVQEYDISRVNEAIKGVREGKPRFRHVLKIQD